MENYEPQWMKEYFIDESDYLKTDTITFQRYFVENGKIMLGHGDHLSPRAGVWEQLEKQFGLLDKYFGIKAAYSYSNRFKYWRPYIPSDCCKKLEEYGTVDVEEVRTVIKITDANAFVRACNTMLKEYLFWCAEHHKCCERGLILPSGFYWEKGIDWELTTDRQKQINERKSKIAYQKRLKEEEKRNLEIRKKLMSYHREGDLQITDFSARYIYDDDTPNWYTISFCVNGLYFGNWQLHHGNRLYMNGNETAVFSRCVFEAVFMEVYNKWKESRKKSDGFSEDGRIQIMTVGRRVLGKVTIEKSKLVVQGIEFEKSKIDD